MSAQPGSFLLAKIRLNRAARRLLWPHPAIYYPVGIVRRRGNVLARDVSFYISGYPRSGNSFARAAFSSVNPGVALRSHRHIPPFVLYTVHCGIPGMLLIRDPVDAAVSWAIHENQSIEEALAYWNDFHLTLMPYRSRLFVVTFEDVTTDFGKVTQAANAYWGTAYVPFEHTKENAARCFTILEEQESDGNGKVREMRVCRPSHQREAVKEMHLSRLEPSAFLDVEMERAREIYESFLNSGPGMAGSPANRHPLFPSAASTRPPADRHESPPPPRRGGAG